MSSLKKALFWAVSVIFVSATSYAGEIGHVPISLNTHTFPHIAKLKPAPDSFQLAKVTFLPELKDSETGWAGNSISNSANKGDQCAGYPLSACPTGASCIKCPFNHKKFRVTGCKSPYLQNGDTCSCPAAKPLACANDKCTQYCGSTCIAKSCSPTADQRNCTNGTQACDDGCCGTNRKCCIPCTNKITGKPANSSYTYSSCTDGSGSHSIQTGWKCNSGYHQSGSSCEKDCIVQNCSGYTLSTCPAHGICSTCTKTASNCSTNGTYKKLDSCESGYKISGNSCVKSCNVANCLECYDFSEYGCSRCADGYRTDIYDQCVPECEEGWSFDGITCMPPDCYHAIPNCKTCANDITCKVCDYGYELSADGQSCDEPAPICEWELTSVTSFCDDWGGTGCDAEGICHCSNGDVEDMANRLNSDEWQARDNLEADCMWYCGC